MKCRLNNIHQIEVQFKPRCKYRVLFHRLVNGKYEQYVKLNNKEYILSNDELKEIKRFIENVKVEEEKKNVRK